MNAATIAYVTKCLLADALRRAGKKFAEIAAELGVSKDRARTMVARGRREAQK